MKKYVWLLALTVMLLNSCGNRFDVKPKSIPETQSGVWYSVMNSTNHFENLTITEDGEIEGLFVKDGKRLDFEGVYDGDKVLIHIYKNKDNKEDYISEQYAVVQFTNNEFVLAKFDEAFFFTRNTKENPYKLKPEMPQLCAEWVHTQKEGSKTYLSLYPDGKGYLDFQSINKDFSYKHEILSWFVINDWIFIKEETKDAADTKYTPKKIELKEGLMILRALNLELMFKDSYGYKKVKSLENSRVESDQPSSVSDSSGSASSSSSSQASQGGGYKPTAHKTSVPIQEWKQCGYCFGSGKCNICNGRGYVYDYSGTITCGCMGGKCSVCAGQGGHYETEYHTRVDYY